MNDPYSTTKLRDTLLAISGLVIYARLREDPAIFTLKNMITDILSEDYKSQSDMRTVNHLAKITESYTSLFGLLMGNDFVQIPDFGAYVFSLAQNDDNAFTKMASETRNGSSDSAISPDMHALVLSDMHRLITIASFPARAITDLLHVPLAPDLPTWRHDTTGLTENDLYTSLFEYHRSRSFGVFARYHAFIWKNSQLQPVIHPDPISLDQLFSYEYEINQARENTLRLLRHSRADNVLLFGSRGTGKSSTVKAIANEYKDRGLRLIEIDKDDLLSIPDLLEYLSQLTNTFLSFILFLDDLTFPEEDTRFTVLKTVLEGGIKKRPDNVAIYATSNRRHIVAEKDSSETYANDAHDELLSLSDRFGISVRFSSPNQQIYLNIVYGILSDRKIEIDREVVAQKALTWAMRENGRSPRTARQFADYYESVMDSPDK